jgi:hypothetical protein
MSNLNITDLEYFTGAQAAVKGGQPFKLDLDLGTFVDIKLVANNNVGSTPGTSSFKNAFAAGVGSGVAASFNGNNFLSFNVGSSIS